MIRYTPQNQLTIDMFENPFEKILDNNNRWVKLSNIVPWDDLASIYCNKLNSVSGRKSVDVRLVLAAIIVKHKLGLDDRGTVEMIQENMYIQYFCGYKTFNPERPFDPSLFVDIRKRLGNKEFDDFNKVVISASEGAKPKRARIQKQTTPQGSDNQDVDNQRKPTVPNKGKLKLDATIADQEINYPTDLKLLNTSREELERLIGIMHKVVGKDDKPRLYRRVARKSYLNIAKKKNNHNFNLYDVI
jgi:IS5 family transposase